MLGRAGGAIDGEGAPRRHDNEGRGSLDPRPSLSHEHVRRASGRFSAPSPAALAARQSRAKYLRISQSVTCLRYSYHSLSLLVTKRSKTWSPSVLRTSSLFCVAWMAS